MAFNIDDFIFHSDYLVYGLSNTFTETLKTDGGTLAAGASKIIYGDFNDVGSGRSYSTATYIVPSLPQSNGAVASGSMAPGAIRKGRNVVSTTRPTGQQPIGIYFFPFASQANGKVRAALRIFNNDSVTRTIPTADWKIKISTYNIPPVTD